MTIVRGPWTTPVTQPGNLSKEEWWTRADDGRLIVRPPYGHPCFAPVPEHEIAAGYPQPNRPPEPSRITIALDINAMEGPEVDEALGVAEPAVDQWETGELVPTSEQVRRLATLTGYPVHFFYGKPMEKPEHVFICKRGRGSAKPRAPKPKPVAEVECSPETFAGGLADARRLVKPEGEK